MSKYRLAVMNDKSLRLEVYEGDEVALLYSGTAPIRDAVDPTQIDDDRKKAIKKDKELHGGKYHQMIDADDLDTGGINRQFEGDTIKEALEAAKKELSARNANTGRTGFNDIEDQIWNMFRQVGPVDPSLPNDLVGTRQLPSQKGEALLGTDTRYVDALDGFFSEYVEKRTVSKSDLVEKNFDVSFQRVELGNGLGAEDGVLIGFKHRGKQVFAIASVDADGNIKDFVEHDGNKLFDAEYLADAELIASKGAAIGTVSPGDAFADRGKKFAQTFEQSFQGAFCEASTPTKLVKDLDKKIADLTKDPTTNDHKGVTFEGSDEIWLHRVNKNHVYLSIDDHSGTGSRKVYKVVSKNGHFTGIEEAQPADFDEIKKLDKSLKGKTNAKIAEAIEKGEFGGIKNAERPITLSTYLSGLTSAKDQMVGMEFINAILGSQAKVVAGDDELKFSPDKKFSVPGHWDRHFVRDNLVGQPYSYIEEKGVLPTTPQQPVNTNTSQPDARTTQEIAELRKQVQEQQNTIAGFISGAAQKAGVGKTLADTAGASVEAGLETGKSFGNSLTNILMGKGGLIGAAVLGGIFGMGQMNAAGQGDKGMLGLLMGAVIAGGLAMMVQKGYQKAVVDGQATHQNRLNQQAADSAVLRGV